MKLAQLAADVHDSVTEGRKWLDQAANDKIPALAAEVTRLQGNLIVQVLEDVALSPAAEQHIAALINAIGTRREQAAAVAGPEAEPAAAEQPIA